MTIKHTMMAAALALGTASVGVPATAQVTQQGGLVNVTVGDVVLQDILSANEIDILRNADIITDNQIQVQVPIGVAANVCPNVNASVLARAAQRGEAECTATSGSQALAQTIRRQHIRR